MSFIHQKMNIIMVLEGNAECGEESHVIDVGEVVLMFVNSNRGGSVESLSHKCTHALYDSDSMQLDKQAGSHQGSVSYGTQEEKMYEEQYTGL